MPSLKTSSVKFGTCGPYTDEVCLPCGATLVARWAEPLPVHMQKEGKGGKMRDSETQGEGKIPGWYGVVWCGMVGCGMAWCGVAWHGMAWHGVAW